MFRSGNSADTKMIGGMCQNTPALLRKDFNSFFQRQNNRNHQMRRITGKYCVKIERQKMRHSAWFKLTGSSGGQAWFRIAQNFDTQKRI